ncbi:Uncharacterized protein OS=Rhodopirellula maiorica SM1 GN=RMSM_00090 PE=4 SV=1 [Gemmata massiliana]|uniref:Uncharacterized protein n=1 Tax=Gemmata massiliana TaxID=1210884 RepID=A0A6P2DJW1_9BACT|nr:hypothetical protein [Gemmata massiliana]VTS00623.1 Uncharacterized protein OS=Rhodopirellula maiorica SM1 GN=RMSM_00090 PE=4 SV=1 [Gemmata massiliana]
MATATLSNQSGRTQNSEAEKHSEGAVARNIENYTAQVPSDWFLWAAGASIVGSLTLHVLNRKEDAQFVGQWVAPFMLLGVYNKIVKVAGSDRVHAS